jgi:two-component system, LytTR family, sensor kinase
MRLEDRLRIEIQVADDAAAVRIPMMLLQTLVENAIKHGIAERLAGGTVRVSATRRGDVLHLRIFNDGPVLLSDWQATHTGVGIGNLRTRLQILHGNDAELHLRSAEPSGAEVVVTLPFREA